MTARVGSLRRGLGLRDRIRPLVSIVGSTLAGEDFIALHMTWGAINESCAQASYGQLARRADDPVLTELLHRIMRQEGRHLDFYASEAAKRLARSGKARTLTRNALRAFWRPVGSGVIPPAEMRNLARYLFGDADGVAATQRIDRRVDRLPGLDGPPPRRARRHQDRRLNRRPLVLASSEPHSAGRLTPKRVAVRQWARSAASRSGDGSSGEVGR